MAAELFSGSRFHNTRLTAVKFLSIRFHFVEAKDSISSRELSGLHKLAWQSLNVMTLKIREAIRNTMNASCSVF